MRIDDQITEFAHEIVDKYGSGHIVSLQEVINRLSFKYKTNVGSIIPADYCYNRVNNGIDIEKKPAVFEYLGSGQYRCLGLNYSYNGVIYHKPKGHSEIAVGKCIEGNRIIAPTDQEVSLTDQKANSSKIQTYVEQVKKRDKHQTSRDPSMKMRFDVMKRDNFKCCACGASPAKDSSVELHIDHIIPWSKGGETVRDNLQTLCAKCNLGKGSQL